MCKNCIIMVAIFAMGHGLMWWYSVKECSKWQIPLFMWVFDTPTLFFLHALSMSVYTHWHSYPVFPLCILNVSLYTMQKQWKVLFVCECRWSIHPHSYIRPICKPDSKSILCVAGNLVGCLFAALYYAHAQWHMPTQNFDLSKLAAYNYCSCWFV